MSSFQPQPCSPIPLFLEKRILLSLEFEEQLITRLVCSTWNNILKPVLASKAIFHVRHPLSIRDPSPTAAAFCKGEWDTELMIPWVEICIHGAIPETPLVKQNGFLQLDSITHLTIVEGDEIFKQIVLLILPSLPNVRYINLREKEFMQHTSRYTKTWGVYNQLYGWNTCKSKWRQGFKILSHLTTFRCCLYDLHATMIYMQLLINAGCDSMELIDIDLSRTFGQPLYFKRVNKVYHIFTKLVHQNRKTLECLRIKWNHRVDRESTYALAMDDYDPFSEFLGFLSPTFNWYEGLDLKYLILNFPVANLADGRVQEYLVPFLQTQTNLQKFSLSRIRWNRAIHEFLSHFPRAMSGQHEYSIHMRDVDAFLMGSMPIVYSFRGIEFLNLTSPDFNTTSVVRRRRMHSPFGRHICKKLPVVLLRVCNVHSNDGFMGFDILDVVQNFPFLHDLELLDNSVGVDSNSEGMWSMTNSEFNLIVSTLRLLRSLKVSRLGKLSDSGLCAIPWDEMEELRTSGVCFLPIETDRVGLFEAKNLHYLEMRDLPETVTDLSVYYAFQLIPNLQKIAFHGNHKITNWGKKILRKKFSRNPFFAVYFKKSTSTVYMNDFP